MDFRFHNLLFVQSKILSVESDVSGLAILHGDSAAMLTLGLFRV